MSFVSVYNDQQMKTEVESNLIDFLSVEVYEILEIAGKD